MNLSRVYNLSNWIFNRVYQPTLVNSILKTPNLTSKNQTFSSLCNFDKCSQSKPLNLTSFNPSVFSIRGMKVKGNLQLRCKDCYFARKDGVMHVFCSSYPRHKQRAMTKREKYTWILTFASQSKQRPY